MGGRSGVCGPEARFNAEISRRVEELRLEYRVRCSDLAKAAGVSDQMLYSYVTGLSRWPVFRLRLIAAYFSVPVERLVPKL